MNEIIFGAIKVVVMIAALAITRYLVPWLREKIGADRLAMAEKWARYAVLKAQQALWEKDGQDKKAYVTGFLEEILIAKGIALSDEQVDVLVEAAVKQMKMEEAPGAVIDALGEAPGSKTEWR